MKILRNVKCLILGLTDLTKKSCRGGHLRNTKKVDQILLCIRYISLLFIDWNSASVPFKSIFFATSIKANTSTTSTDADVAVILHTEVC